MNAERAGIQQAVKTGIEFSKRGLPALVATTVGIAGAHALSPQTSGAPEPASGIEQQVSQPFTRLNPQTDFSHLPMPALNQEREIVVNRGTQAETINIAPRTVYDQTVVESSVLETAPQTIIDSFTKVDSNGNEQAQYIIAPLTTDGSKVFLYKAIANPTAGNQFDKPFAAAIVNEISIARPFTSTSSVRVAGDVLGNGIVLLGGGGDVNSKSTLLQAVFKGENVAKSIDWDKGNLGPVMDVLKTNDPNKALAVLLPATSSTKSMVVVDINPSTREVETTLLDFPEMPYSLRPSIEAADPGHQIFIATGAAGINRYDIDFNNPSNSKVQNLYPEKGTLQAISQYKDVNGVLHYFVSNRLSGKVIDIDTSKPISEAIELEYAGFLNGKIMDPTNPKVVRADYDTNSTSVTVLADPKVDAQGNVTYYLGGRYTTPPPGGNGSAIMHPVVFSYMRGTNPLTDINALTVIDMHSQNSNAGFVKGMRFKDTSAGVLGIVVTTKLGQEFVPLKPDGSLGLKADMFGIGNGIGSQPLFQGFLPGVQRSASR